MQKVSVVQLQREITAVKKEMKKMKKKLVTMPAEPIIIEKLQNDGLTLRQRKLLEDAISDWRAGKRNKFVTLEELRTKYA